MAMSKRRTKRNKSLITWVTRSSWRALHLGAGWQPIDLQSADQPVHYVAVHSRIHTRPCGIFTPWALSTSMAQRLLHSSSHSFKIPRHTSMSSMGIERHFPASSFSARKSFALRRAQAPSAGRRRRYCLSILKR